MNWERWGNPPLVPTRCGLQFITAPFKNTPAGQPTNTTGRHPRRKLGGTESTAPSHHQEEPQQSNNAQQTTPAGRAARPAIDSQPPATDNHPGRLPTTHHPRRPGSGTPQEMPVPRPTAARHANADKTPNGGKRRTRWQPSRRRCPTKPAPKADRWSEVPARYLSTTPWAISRVSLDMGYPPHIRGTFRLGHAGVCLGVGFGRVTVLVVTEPADMGFSVEQFPQDG